MPQSDTILYLLYVAGAVAVWMLMPGRRAGGLKALGALLGAASLGGLWLYLSRSPYDLGLESSAIPFYYIFSAIAIVAAVRVITHTRPVYAALWFIMVVLASAGLFLVLSAEFMAFALAIIYGGAILVTYMFVIMLAAHAGDPTEPGDAPEYDRVAREPAVAVASGFLLLAVLLSVTFRTESFYSDPARTAGPSDAALIAEVLPERAQQRLREGLPPAVTVEDLELTEGVLGGPVGNVTNVERIGIDLFRSHPLGLELAGVILLVALVGAVVIARTRVEEEEGAPPAA